MATDITIDEKKYVICYNLDTMLLHYVVMQPGQHLSTGQPEVELFPTEWEAIERMIELGFDPNDYVTIYEFLLYTDVQSVQQQLDLINECLNGEYVSTYELMYETDNDSFMGYVILIDDKNIGCLTETQLLHIMTATSNEVYLK